MSRDQSRVRVGKRTAAVLAGEEDISEWSDEELIRGQRRDKNGNWNSKRPNVVPMALHQELNNRRLHEAKQILSDSIVRAAEVLREVMDDPLAENRDKIAAAKLVLQTVTGRADFELKIEATPPWIEALMGGIVALPTGDVVDVECSEYGDGR